MTISIASYAFCDGTLENGVAVTELGETITRLTDFAQPLGGVSPVAYDRVGRRGDFSFVVKRTHATVADAETFILELEDNIPATGTVTFTTSGPTPDTTTIQNGFLITHELVQESGATTFHRYQIAGGPPTA